MVNGSKDRGVCSSLPGTPRSCPASDSQLNSAATSDQRLLISIAARLVPDPCTDLGVQGLPRLTQGMAIASIEAARTRPSRHATKAGMLCGSSNGPSQHTPALD